jgi:RimJ/RimL family protein N-acetyltransferase
MTPTGRRPAVPVVDSNRVSNINELEINGDYPSLFLVMFTTERLHLRAIHPTDEDVIVNLMNDSRIRANVSPDYTVPLDKTAPWMKDILSNIIGSTLSVMIELKSTGEVVGFTRMHCAVAKNRDVEFGMAIDPRFWNAGYGSEATRFMIDYAFHNLGMHRMSLQVFGMNSNAIHLYKRL